MSLSIQRVVIVVTYGYSSSEGMVEGMAEELGQAVGIDSTRRIREQPLLRQRTRDEIRNVGRAVANVGEPHRHADPLRELGDRRAEVLATLAAAEQHRGMAVALGAPAVFTRFVE